MDAVFKVLCLEYCVGDHPVSKVKKHQGLFLNSSSQHPRLLSGISQLPKVPPTQTATGHHSVDPFICAWLPWLGAESMALLKGRVLQCRAPNRNQALQSRWKSDCVLQFNTYKSHMK